MKKIFNFFKKRKNNNEDVTKGVDDIVEKFTEEDKKRIEQEDSIRKLYFLIIDKLNLKKGEQYEELLVYHFLSEEDVTIPVFFFDKFSEKELKDFIEIFKENDYEEKDIVATLEKIGKGSSVAKGFERLLSRIAYNKRPGASVSAGHTAIDVVELLKGAGYSLFDVIKYYKEADLLIRKQNKDRGVIGLLGLSFGEEATYALIQLMDIFEDVCRERKDIIEKAKKDTESLVAIIDMLKKEGFNEGHILLAFKEAYSKEEVIDIFERNGFPILKEKINEVFDTKYGDNWESNQIKLIPHTIPRTQKRKEFIEKLDKKDELFSDIGVVLRRKSVIGGRNFRDVYGYVADIV